jgi:hypothetical protein
MLTNGTQIAGNPWVITEGRNTYVYARGTNGDLLVFVAREPIPWGVYNITEQAGPRISSEPVVVTDGPNTYVYVR